MAGQSHRQAGGERQVVEGGRCVFLRSEELKNKFNLEYENVFGKRKKVLYL